MASVKITSIVEQLSGMSIPFKQPSDPDWAAYSSSLNTRLSFTPAIVVIPCDVSQIERALTCARKHELKVQARSGGHSYASHSIGGVDGAMVIDMRRFQSTNIEGNTVLVDSGVRLGNLAKAIYDDSDQKRALPHGTCAAVGMGGHLTHGGFGMFSRAWGLAMDRIVGMTVITADGKCIHCDQSVNGDLFFAMRGAGDSFGIVKSFHLDTEPAPKSVLHWSVNMNDVTKSIERAVKAFHHIQKFVHNGSVVDRRLGLQMCVSWNRFAVDGTYLGPQETLETKILPAMLGKIKEEKKTILKEFDWLESIKSLNQSQDIVTDPTSTHQDRVNFFAKSVVVPEPGLTQVAMRSFFKYLFNEGARAPINYFILIDLYGGHDSQINEKSSDFSAFSHRNACWVIQLHGYVDNDVAFPQEGIEFITGLTNSITSKVRNYGAYANYTDPTLSREEAQKLYFGETSKILWKLKKKWDPNNLFENPQSIQAD
ncbi:putative glucooligosaccharide oxidase [Annulohypoxylon maeteangense]|uniref:putative glucooligosaccharide oxidase n=1 Tax=Annulohypoxylon maeteangense TaxID=1927788 RepID=UPI002007D8B1|nr:putative glucooligosaccharide oxidase [Annulohypoxylon maeteangense]KAI0880935.1 putative glucooligosaccharide oxidase [Annulohypoxylon maeteangense]